MDSRLRGNDVAGAMRGLAELRAPVDAFFDKVVKADEAHAPQSKRLVSGDAPSSRLIGTIKARKRGRKTD